jgi:2-dehydro-3-deoxyphosphogluconate aldolase/(4S)-4-hydroxy-2-oxoglutarate aldolase
MNVNDYPKITIIMRGYTFEQEIAILEAIKLTGKNIAVEVTMNSENAVDNIRKLNEMYGDKVLIGAGTVRSVDDIKKVVKAGAKFALGPHFFTKEMFEECRKSGILSVPAAMTPSEINKMFALGADIVKIFPAGTVGAKFFKDVQAPMGKMRLMAVGGVSANNIKEYFTQEAEYVGIGSNLFSKEDLIDKNIDNLKESILKLFA